MPDDHAREPPRSAGEELLGREAHVQILGPYCRFVPRPAPLSEGETVWKDLDPHEHDDVVLRSLLLRMGIHQARWESVTPALRSLLKRVAAGMEWLELAVFDSLQRPGGYPPDPDLANKADQLLTPFAMWLDGKSAVTGGYADATDRTLSHHWATKAKTLIVKLLRETKIAAMGSHGVLGKRERTAKSVMQINEILGSWNLKQCCTSAHLSKLAVESASNVAYRILADASGLSVDDLRRGAPRLSR